MISIKNWAPHLVCRTCVENLRQWTKHKRKSIGFAVPMVWRKQANHFNGYYFCMTNVIGCSKSKGNIKHPDLPSAIRPTLHCADLPPPLFTSYSELVDEPASSILEESSLEDDCYNSFADKSPILIA